MLYRSRTDSSTSVLLSNKPTVNQSEGQVLRSLKKRSLVAEFFISRAFGSPKQRRVCLPVEIYTMGRNDATPNMPSHYRSLSAFQRIKVISAAEEEEEVQGRSHTFTLRAGLFQQPQE